MSNISSKPSVLIVGIGEVGRYLLEFLVRDDSLIDIVAADVHLQGVEAKVHTSLSDLTNPVLGALLSKESVSTLHG